MPSIKDLWPDRWLRPNIINGHQPRVVIEQVGLERLFNPRTKREEPRLVVKFHKKELRLILNKTQAHALAAICKSDDYSKWGGHEVLLSVTKAPNGADTIVINPVPDAMPAMNGRANGNGHHHDFDNDLDELPA